MDGWVPFRDCLAENAEITWIGYIFSTSRYDVVNSWMVFQCFLRATWPKWSKMVKNNAFSFWTHAMNMQDSGPVYICTYISCTYTYVYPFMSYVHFVYTCIEILSMYTRLSEHSVIVVPEVGKDSLGAGHAETLLKNMSRKGFFPQKNPTASLGCWGSGIL